MIKMFLLVEADGYKDSLWSLYEYSRGVTF
jgi:hypothetical protein